MSGDLTPDIVRSLIDYDPETGILTWLHRPVPKTRGIASWNAKYAGKEAFTALTTKGYRSGTILSNRLQAHRLIWFMLHGRWPEQIDHINGDKQDNRHCNLREVNNRENHRNRRRQRDLPLGVYQSVSGKRWVATIGHYRYGEQAHLGTFDTLEEATAARLAAEQERGFHPNHGRIK